MSSSLAFAAIWAVCGSSEALSADAIRVAVTTSFENSGLAGWLIPRFESASGRRVSLLVAGSGRALQLARQGDVDVIVSHSPVDEEAFMASGFGSSRDSAMRNDFLLVGPSSDSSGLRGVSDVSEALRRIASDSSATFVSRGDSSGTHRKEQELFAEAGVEFEAGDVRLKSVGSGMGRALNVASALDAYILVDRGSWLNFANRGGLEALVEGDSRLRNPYSVITVSAKRHPHVDSDGANAFRDWLLSDEGQHAIKDFRIDGKTVFLPDARQ